jgi:diguanylate cyclase (GGDEF)-like protein
VQFPWFTNESSWIVFSFAAAKLQGRLRQVSIAGRSGRVAKLKMDNEPESRMISAPDSPGDLQKTTTHPSPLPSLPAWVLFAAIYFCLGKLGLKLAFVNASATSVWPPTGIALAAFLLLGNGVWSAIFVAAFLVNLTTTGSWATSIGIALGNTAEGLVGAYLVDRFAGGLSAFNRPHNVFRFTVLAVLLSTAVSPTFGVTSLSLGGYARWADYWPIWQIWWLGDAVSSAIVTPLLVLAFTQPFPRWNWRKLLEGLVLGLCLAVIGFTVFGNLSFPGINNYPLEVLCIPFLIWAAFRFSELEAATVVPFLSAIAIWGTLHGYGPFVRDNPNESLLLLLAFLGVVAVMTTATAAVVSEHRRIEQSLRSARDKLEEQVSTDPLTGLANYRRLVDALDAEADRSQRSGRSFALLLFDLNGLKKINDRHGHLVGSRALCRVANILRLHCRSIDTAARYGGDEFALLLPEMRVEGARYVADRILERMRMDSERPPISVSVGIALYPQDGTTFEDVFRAADRALYAMKNDNSC